MSPSDEELYLQLRTQFTEELSLVEQQILDLQDRRDQLVNLLNAAGPATVVFTPEEDPEPVIRRRKEKTENNPEERAAIDKDLRDFIFDHPNSGRTDIVDGMEARGWSPWDVDKSMKRCRNAGVIVREGQTRTATWSVAKGK